jgi:hypothetical protein
MYSPRERERLVGAFGGVVFRDGDMEPDNDLDEMVRGKPKVIQETT